VATFEDVREIALGLPETDERATHGQLGWRVRGALFVWERPLRAADLKALGAAAPVGPILGARVEDEREKEALIAGDPGVYFTTPHFEGYPAVLLSLDRVPSDELERRVVEAWLTRAPVRIARAFLASGEAAPPAGQ
jgi:hypothetical protein